MAKKKTAPAPSTAAETSFVLDAPSAADTAQVPMFFDPDMITLTDNTRLKLKPARVAQLADDIREIGKVLEPVGVEEMAGGGFELIYGKYRHAAVKQLNTEGVDLQLPAIVYANLDPVKRLRMQVSENLVRESLSLVDKALSMKALLDKGLSKVEVRHIFASAGGRKGNAVQDMSNVHLNNHLAILDFSKSIQEKIDDGVLGIAAVAKLLKVEPGLRESVVKQAEAARQAELDAEEKAEDRYIKSENARAEIEEKKEAEAKRLTDLKAEIAGLIVAGKEAEKAIKAVNAKHSLKATKEEAAAWMQEMKEATEANIANQKVYKLKSNELAKLKAKLSKAENVTEDAPKPKPNGKTSIGPAAIEAAAEKVTGAPATRKLKVSELEVELKEMRKLGGDSPAFVKVVDVFSKLITGELTTKEAASDIADVLEVVLSVKPVSRRKK